MKVFILFVIISTAYAQVRVNPCENLPAALAGNGFVNDYSHCPSYYSCVNYLPFVVDCPEPFYFKTTAPGEGLCQWPDAVNCEPCPAEGLVMIHVRGHCDQFTLCVDGTPIPRTCPPGQLFDRQLGLCANENTVDCS